MGSLIDPLKMLIFHRFLYVYQRVNVRISETSRGWFQWKLLLGLSSSFFFLNMASKHQILAEKWRVPKSWGYPQIIQLFPMDFPWISHGFPMKYSSSSEFGLSLMIPILQKKLHIIYIYIYIPIHTVIISVDFPLWKPLDPSY